MDILVYFFIKDILTFFHSVFKQWMLRIDKSLGYVQCKKKDNDDFQSMNTHRQKYDVSCYKLLPISKSISLSVETQKPIGFFEI